MLKFLDGSGSKALGAEISGGYKKEDLEAIKQAFEKQLEQGEDKVNILIKVDGMKVAETEFKAFWGGAHYALSNLDKLGHIAVVGHSAVEKVIVKLDNMILGNKKAGREQKYFDVADIDQAWDFVNG